MSQKVEAHIVGANDEPVVVSIASTFKGRKRIVVLFFIMLAIVGSFVVALLLLNKQSTEESSDPAGQSQDWNVITAREELALSNKDTDITQDKYYKLYQQSDASANKPPKDYTKEDLEYIYFLIEFNRKNGAYRYNLILLQRLDEAAGLGVVIDNDDLGWTTEYREAIKAESLDGLGGNMGGSQSAGVGS